MVFFVLDGFDSASAASAVFTYFQKKLYQKERERAGERERAEPRKECSCVGGVMDHKKIIVLLLRTTNQISMPHSAQYGPTPLVIVSVKPPFSLSISLSVFLLDLQRRNVDVSVCDVC